MPSLTGVILGSSFGSIDASAAFMNRIFAKGPRLASPAEFPNLVPSSPVGHVSIYLGLRGAVFAAAELGTSGECAVLQAAELVAAGETDAVVAGDIEESNGIVERVLSALFARDGRGEGRGKRGEGGRRSSSRPRRRRARAARRGHRAHRRRCASWRDGDPFPELPRRPRCARALSSSRAGTSSGVDALLAADGVGRRARA